MTIVATGLATCMLGSCSLAGSHDDEFHLRFWEDFRLKGDQARSTKHLDAAQSNYKQAIAEAQQLSSSQYHMMYGLNRLADIYFQKGQYDQAEQTYRRNLQLLGSQARTGGDAPAVAVITPYEEAMTYSGLADISLKQQKLQEAGQFYDRALSIINGLLQSKSQYIVQEVLAAHAARAFTGLAIVREGLGNRSGSIECLEKARQLTVDFALSDPLQSTILRMCAAAEPADRTSKNPTDLEQAAELQEKAFAYAKSGELDLAAVAYEQELSLLRNKLPISDLGLTEPVRALASIKLATKKLDQADKLLEMRSAAQESLEASNPIVLAETIYNRASGLEDMGDYARAAQLYKKTTTLLEKAHNENRPQYALSLYMLGRLAERQNDTQTECSYYQKALDCSTKFNTLSDEIEFYALTKLRGYYANNSRTKEHNALTPRLKQRLVPWLKQHLHEHPHTPVYLLRLRWLGNIYVEEGNVDAAEPLFKQVLSELEKKSGRADLELAISKVVLADLYHRTKRDSLAEPLFRQALAIYKEAGRINDPAVTGCIYNECPQLRAEGK